MKAATCTGGDEEGLVKNGPKLLCMLNPNHTGGSPIAQAGCCRAKQGMRGLVLYCQNNAECRPMTEFPLYRKRQATPHDPTENEAGMPQASRSRGGMPHHVCLSDSYELPESI